ncbi:hypothetical protein J7F01_15260 [Streptomyces sp. ISL-22]|uniref:hypothetical protein n=1 Tax=unclassified Streptomyces TaxID=2593676 RepID=UPI001BE54088|nr:MULTISPECIES: hypothetical protein [unclassified Streptomyces]MBT2423797.1 hypothetical protein [Streptomyces sp. ISL-24]MBT2433517.1 hypothetical protein [Streptomyces sp. ISL-22]
MADPPRHRPRRDRSRPSKPHPRHALTAWALLYLPLTVWWWPAVLITAVLAVAGRQRTRAAADIYATLIEAAARLHARALADCLGLDLIGTPTQDSGETLMLHPTASAPPAPTPEPDTNSESAHGT